MIWFVLRIAVWLAAVASLYLWLRRGLGRQRRLRHDVVRALAGFAAQRDTLGEAFRTAAQATGKPRGLVWTRCDLAEPAPRLAQDHATGELLALCGVTIAFEADPNGDMVEVEAVANLRDGTAVFAWREGRWRTDGRAVFNLSPEQTLQRYADSLSAVDG